MENNSNINVNNSSRVVYVGLASVIANLKKFEAKKECRWFAQKSGNYDLYLRFILSTIFML